MAKTVLVTGANRGIGLELCRLLQARGESVIGVCRSSSKELDALGVRVEAGIDVQREESVGDLQKRMRGTKLDLLINNAGLLRVDAFGGIGTSDLLAQFETNALGPVLVTQALGDALQSGSKVALITSRMGSIADNTSGSMYGYRMSKAALNAAGVSLAHDLKSRGVAVVMLHPGYVRTEMTARNGNTDPGEAAAMLLARIDELTLETSGRFLHANGEPLPW
ncbi:MAG TPA: SDR family oxidoreductase [Polyangiaceae bacterium]|nr:SDR family oxidoreductase [Polyangiaceae bacterium]